MEAFKSGCTPMRTHRKLSEPPPPGPTLGPCILSQDSEVGLVLAGELWCNESQEVTGQSTGVSGTSEQLAPLLAAAEDEGEASVYLFWHTSPCCQPTRKGPNLAPPSQEEPFSILLGCPYHENTPLSGSKS